MEYAKHKLEYWVIANPTTGCFLKAAPGQQTWQLPDVVGSPRLYSTERGAKATLTKWLRGPHRMTYVMPGGWDSGMEPDGIEVVEDSDREPQHRTAARLAAGLEVLPATLLF